MTAAPPAAERGELAVEPLDTVEAPSLGYSYTGAPAEVRERAKAILYYCRLATDVTVTTHAGAVLRGDEIAGEVL